MWNKPRTYRKLLNLNNMKKLLHNLANQSTVNLPTKRPFQWWVLIVLVFLYFLGNLAGIPLLHKTNMPIEPVWQWAILTVIFALVIAVSLLMANEIGLGAPLIEGKLPKGQFSQWLRSGLALTSLMLVVATPFSLIANLGADAATYPYGWELFFASIKAGIGEEILSRLFLVSLFAWIGHFIKRDLEGRPSRAVYWSAIVLAGLLFGWAHIDARLGHPTATFWDYAYIMFLSSSVGFFFGWLYWKLGLEMAMFAHFTYDAFVSIVLIPVYLLKSPVAWLILLIGLVAVVVISIRHLVKR
jgi:hypothetical protein